MDRCVRNYIEKSDKLHRWIESENNGFSFRFWVIHQHTQTWGWPSTSETYLHENMIFARSSQPIPTQRSPTIIISNEQRLAITNRLST